MRGIATRRSALLAALVPVALVAGALVGAMPAQASTCSDKTGGDNDRLIKADNTETDADGWNCAYVYDFSVKIGAFMPGFQYHTTAMGYQKTYECHNQTGGVSIDTVYMDGGGVAPSSQEWWAYNTQDGSRHWRGAVLMMTRKNSKDPAANQYTKGCVDNTIPFNAIYAVTASMSASATSVPAGSAVTLTLKLSGPDGPVPTGVQMGVARVTGTSPDPTKDPIVAGGVVTNGSLVTTMQVAPGSYSYYPVFKGSDWTTMKPPSSGWTPAQGKAIVITGTSSSSAVLTGGAAHRVEIARATPHPDEIAVVTVRGKGSLDVECPEGYALQLASVSSRTRAYGPTDLTRDHNRVFAEADGSPSALQLVCRQSRLDMRIIGKRGYGSTRDDIMGTTMAGSLFTAGLGNDRVISRHARSFLDGGGGSDNVRLYSSGVGSGSFGADRLWADGNGALLIGGRGRDTFTTGAGRAYVNAVDGRGGDTVTCGSAKTRVLADPGDILAGPCTLVR